jgi:hypothetical protein
MPEAAQLFPVTTPQSRDSEGESWRSDLFTSRRRDVACPLRRRRGALRT